MAGQWDAVQRLIGEWEGSANGHPGTGSQVRKYQPILRGTFVMGTNRTSWQPTPDNAEGETHEDLAIFSLDRAASQIVMRSFFVEGFACEYRCVDAADDGSRLVFEAPTVENGGTGMRARETFVFLSPDELESTFELASAGHDFSTYTTERLKRVSSA